MTNKIIDGSERHAKVKATGRGARKVNAEAVALALGVATAESQLGGHTHTVFAVLHRDFARRLKSSGGRPKLAGTTRRQKIPLQESDWETLVRIAEALRAQDIKATPGQVASTILHRVLGRIELDDVIETAAS